MRHRHAEAAGVALDRVVGFLEAQGIRLYRISSNVIPFASHPVNRLGWWDEFAPAFERIGRTPGRRLTLTPRPFDCMLEAKEKDRALLKLRADLQPLGIESAPAAARPPGPRLPPPGPR